MKVGDRMMHLPSQKAGTVRKVTLSATKQRGTFVVVVLQLDAPEAKHMHGALTTTLRHVVPLDEWTARFSDVPASEPVALQER